MRGDDWYDAPHFVLGYGNDTKHLYFITENYLQLDNRNQEETGWGDYYNGGYEFTGTFAGDMTEVDDDCYEWSNGDTLCFQLAGYESYADESYAELIGTSQVDSKPYSTFSLIGMALISVAILAGIRKMMQKRAVLTHDMYVSDESIQV